MCTTIFDVYFTVIMNQKLKKQKWSAPTLRNVRAPTLGVKMKF